MAVQLIIKLVLRLQNANFDVQGSRQLEQRTKQVEELQQYCLRDRLRPGMPRNLSEEY
jgi:hypothetical protein